MAEQREQSTQGAQGAQILAGSVEEIIFHNEENGYTVLILDDGRMAHTLVGSLVSPAIGEELEAEGAFANHPTHGPQFKATSIVRKMPAGTAAIKKYLSSGAVKGVGPVLAERMVRQFGDQTLEIFEHSPHRLTEVRGVSPQKAEAFGEEFRRIFGLRAVLAFLASLGIDAQMAVAVYKRLGAEAPELVRQNPYALCCEEIGLAFERADELAEQFGLAPDCPERLGGGLLHVLRHNLQNGHCCLPYDKLLGAAAALLDMGSDPLDDALTALCDAGELVAQQQGGGLYVYLPDCYADETYIADRLMALLGQGGPEGYAAVRESAEAGVEELEAAEGIEYAPEQRSAIVMALTQPVFILTGGPGTGKTTALKAVLALLEARGDKVALAAPTGRAAKRMGDVCGREAKTLHRLLEAQFGDDGATQFARGAKNPLPHDVVVVDEMSMVDMRLFAALLRALRLSCRLVLVGDPDQLPSVGPGNLLGDMIASGSVPTVHLTKIFRQAAQSAIVRGAHAIVRGEMPELSLREAQDDFFFLPYRSAEQAAQSVVQLVTKRLPAAYGLSPLWGIQVLCPSRMGELGTRSLNLRLQEALNPPGTGKVEISMQGFKLREGDKVMQIKNNYDIQFERDDGELGAGVFNGDIGVVTMIDRPTKSVHVRYEDRVAEYLFDILHELELAYAVTVHKSQGSEFDAVVLPLFGRHRKLFYRNLLYTAVTRAKKLLVVAGERESVEQMVANNRRTLRYTLLCEYLK